MYLINDSPILLQVADGQLALMLPLPSKMTMRKLVAEILWIARPAVHCTLNTVSVWTICTFTRSIVASPFWFGKLGAVVCVAGGGGHQV